MTTVYYTDSTPGTAVSLLNETASLADWASRIQMTEGTGVNTGKWSATVTTNGRYKVFEGATQPADWEDNVGTIVVDDSLNELLDRVPTSGDYTLTVNVTDASTDDEIEGATVTLSRTGQRSVGSTNASGVATLGVDAATWTYVVRAGGYASKTGIVVVSANQSLAVELDAIVLPAPSNPDTSALVILCLDANGDPEPDVSIDIRIVTVPSGDQNIAYKGTKQTATSDANGYATLQAIKGAVYEYKRGKAEVWSKVTIGSGSATNVQSVIGSP